MSIPEPTPLLLIAIGLLLFIAIRKLRSRFR